MGSSPVQPDVRAVHLPGGNRFDDVRIDVDASHARLNAMPRPARMMRRGRVSATIDRMTTHALVRAGLQELLVMNGVARGWLVEFEEYWCAMLGGRPFWQTADFLLLLHDYRRRNQQSDVLDWSAPARHVAHWQACSNLYSTFHQARKLALQPLVTPPLWPHVPRGGRVLEYGCSLAPYYHCYRRFYSHLGCRWVLADLPNFPFHYARYRYRHDADVECQVITAERFADPLGDAQPFDVIIVTAVFEHVDDPVFVARYLLDRLRPGGVLVFDFIRSQGEGLDHPGALAAREDCLALITARTAIVSGTLADPSASIGLTIAKARAA